MIRPQSFKLQSYIQHFHGVAGLGRMASPIAGAMIVMAIGGALWWLLALRWSPPDQAGYFVAALGIAALLAEITNLGVNYVVIRHFATAGELASPLIRTGLAILTLSAIAGVTCFAIIIRALEVNSLLPLQSWAFLLLLIMVLSLAWYGFTDSLLLALGMRRTLFVFSAVISAGRIAFLVVFAIYDLLNSYSLIVSYITPFSIASLTISLILRRVIFDNSKKQLFLHRSQIHHFTPYAFQTYLGNAIGVIPPTLLPALVVWELGPVAGAQYGAMWAIAGLVMLIPNAVSLASFSTVARGESRSKHMISRGIWLIVAVVLPIIIAILAFARFLLPYLGSIYAELDVGYLAPLLVGVLISGLTAQIYTQARLVDRGLLLIIIGQSLQTILVLGLAFYLITIWGLTGVSFAWLIGTSFTLMIILLLSRSFLSITRVFISSTPEH